MAGSEANTVALNPGGNLIDRAASSAGIGEPSSRSLSYGSGKVSAWTAAAAKRIHRNRMGPP
jgi:hypothetical protein